MPEVVIVASTFGVDAIRKDGHHAWLHTAAKAGAAGFEVRRELFALEAQASPEALSALGKSIAAQNLWSVYSTPAELYAPDGALDETALREALIEATALGARFVKLQLGGFAGRAYGEAIAKCTKGVAARLVVENGQMERGGSLAQFETLFNALAKDARNEGRKPVLGMTFDIGNWQWPGVDPVEAARKLAHYVEYIHCKAVAGEGARRFAVAPAADDPVFAAVLALLPRDVARGIEFPFDAARIAQDASHHVARLASA
ncbi:Xylose isomerase domain-containing protein [Paraburkholderia piptadeniae]|uniref:Xylose isomerase domain-containing protein n=1 Tax=Paraburkholderia piptadeniae TaxID=1701573 RepID=A0A1N7S4U8_9BURK|nr:TIM barrel protein [Paraburkholderia piptadeniae]SIT42335.1 Xylose isomerase domain-containing protein [Paraburkholderia piptadeniae]